MRNATYIIHRLKKLPNSNEISTKHITVKLKGRRSNKIYTKIKFNQPCSVATFHKAIVTNRELINCASRGQTRWILGNKRVRHFIEEKVFEAYYKLTEKEDYIFVAQCDKRNDACRALKKICEDPKAGAKFALCQEELNIDQAFDDYDSKCLLNSYLSGNLWKSDTNPVTIHGVSLKREAEEDSKTIDINVAFGSDITRNASIKTDCENGNLTYLRIRFPCSQDEYMQAGISKCGSIHFMTHSKPENCLPFVEYIAEKYFL